MGLKPIRYTGTHAEDFSKVLRQRVNNYFKERNISKHANGQMYLKTAGMLCFYWVPFTLMLTLSPPSWVGILLWLAMGIGLAGIGLSIMHDANHGAYSQNPTVNKWVGYTLLMCGGSDLNWRIQHNLLHHTYTNVHGHDEDISPVPILRFSPDAKRLGIHRFQHLYAWFFYGLMTFMWITSKDFTQAIRYHKKDLLKSQKTTLTKHILFLIIFKVVYLSVYIGLPIYLTDMSVWLILGGFFLMHFVAGFILGIVFQPAHVVPVSNYPVPDPTGNVDADWAVSQMLNTANFARKSKLLSWYVGGLNYQIEHHLFPSICHIHYRGISEIVKETAEEFGLPYYDYPTFYGAILEHGRMLYNLGHFDNAKPIHA